MFSYIYNRLISRLVAVFFLFGCGLNSYTQDTLVYLNRSAEAVEIITVSKSSQTITYKINERTKVISMGSIVRYKHKDEWVELMETDNQALYPVKLKKRMIDRNFLSYRSSWSIGTNLSSLLLSLDESKLNQSIRRMATLEPEYRMKNNWLSIKGTLDIGLPYPEVGVYQSNPIYYSYPIGYYSYGSVHIDPNRRQEDLDRYVAFQSGLSLKFWPSDMLRERFFFHLGFVAGIADYNAITVYDSYESTQNDWGNTYYKQVGQSIEVESNEFFFFRPEMGLGYNFLLHKRFSFSIDLAITSKPKNGGEKTDVIYAKADQEDFKKIYEGVYSDPYYYQRSASDNFLLRFKLIYHFKRQETN